MQTFLNTASWSKTKKICVSGMVAAMYIAIMLATQAFAFGAYQVRIATALYALAYFYPFLIFPLGLANGLSNFIGSMGPWDMPGGTLVGIITSGAVYAVRRYKLPTLLIVPIITLIPGLIVPIWLSPVTGVPYTLLAVQISIGQLTPAVVGYVFVKTLTKMQRKTQ